MDIHLTINFHSEQKCKQILIICFPVFKCDLVWQVFHRSMMDIQYTYQSTSIQNKSINFKQVPNFEYVFADKSGFVHF